jgi:hypothetical protein
MTPEGKTPLLLYHAALDRDNFDKLSLDAIKIVPVAYFQFRDWRAVLQRIPVWRA